MPTLLFPSLGRAAAFIERHDLLAKTYILMLCLIFALPNVWAVRNLYYFILLPIFLIAIRRDELWAILRSPIMVFAALYFLVFALAAPFTESFGLRSFMEHIRNSFMVGSFL